MTRSSKLLAICAIVTGVLGSTAAPALAEGDGTPSPHQHSQVVSVNDHEKEPSKRDGHVT